MQVYRTPNARAALALILTLPMGIAPQDAAIVVREVSDSVGNEYAGILAAQIAADPEMASTWADYAMGGDSDLYEVDYVWYSSATGRQESTCVGAVLTHHNGGRAYAIW